MLTQEIISTLIFGGIGVAMAVLVFFIIDMIMPGNLRKQIAKEGHIALAIVAGCLMLGVCIIIAAAII